MDVISFLKIHLGDHHYSRRAKGMLLEAVHVATLNPPERQPFRKNGEPFYTHCLSAASTLIDFDLPAYIVCSAVMHDVVEDSNFHYSFEQVQQYFGQRIRLIIEGVTKLPKDQFATKVDRIIESYRRMIKMLPRRWEIIFVKLADRKHNLETLGAFEPEKQAAICDETLWCLVPIARHVASKYVPASYRSALHDLIAAVEREAQERAAIATAECCRRLPRQTIV